MGLATRSSACSRSPCRRAQLCAIAAVLLAAGCGSDSAASEVEPVYGDPCKYVLCGPHGTCQADGMGQPFCACDEVYSGERCDDCAPGFHLNLENVCLPNERCFDQDPDLCGPHGGCQDDSGSPECACDP